MIQVTCPDSQSTLFNNIFSLWHISDIIQPCLLAVQMVRWFQLELTGTQKQLHPGSSSCDVAWSTTPWPKKQAQGWVVLFTVGLTLWPYTGGLRNLRAIRLCLFGWGGSSIKHSTFIVWSPYKHGHCTSYHVDVLMVSQVLAHSDQ